MHSHTVNIIMISLLGISTDYFEKIEDANFLQMAKVPSMSFYPDFIQILTRSYQIFRNSIYPNFILTLSGKSFGKK